MKLGYVVVAIIAAVVAVFALQNGDPTAVRFIVWTADGPLKVSGGERPGAWACPMQSAMVVGAARLAITLGMVEARGA